MKRTVGEMPENPEIGDVWGKIEDYEWTGKSWLRGGKEGSTGWGFTTEIIPHKKNSDETQNIC